MLILYELKDINMAQQTAQYEALQYSSQREDQDFGGFAMELAEQEKQREALEYKRKREEEQFQMDMINNNPDVVYASFENSGLENVDAYNAKVSELVKGRFNELNAQYNKDGDRMKYFTAVAKLKGEVKGYTTGVNNIIKYGQDLVAKGDEVSASTLYRSQQLDKMFKSGAPTMSADGSIGNVSMSVGEDGKPMSEAFNWGKASSLIGVKGRSDMHAVATESVKTFGDPSKFMVPKGQTILSTLLERDGTMNQAGLRLIEDNTRALSDEDLIDTADQMDIDVNFDRKDITKFDRERIVKEVAKREAEYAIDLLKMKEKEDDVSYAEFTLKAKEQARKDKKTRNDINKSKDDPKSAFSHFNTQRAQSELGIGCSADVYTIANPEEVDGVFGEFGDEFVNRLPQDSVLNRSIANKNVVGKPIITNYIYTADGRNIARASFITKELDVETGQTIERTRYENLELSRQEANIVRFKSGLSQLTDSPDDPNKRRAESAASTQAVRSSTIYKGSFGETRDASTEFSSSETTEKTTTKKGKDTLNLFGDD